MQLIQHLDALHMERLARSLRLFTCHVDANRTTWEHPSTLSYGLRLVAIFEEGGGSTIETVEVTYPMGETMRVAGSMPVSVLESLVSEGVLSAAHDSALSRISDERRILDRQVDHLLVANLDRIEHGVRDQ